jgi:beta-glucosidase
VSDEAFATLLGHEIPDQKIKIDRNITFNQLNHGRSPLFWLVWLGMTLLKKKADRSGKPNLNLLFIYNMPLRALQKMMGGMFSMGMVDALVMEIQGFWIIGLLRFVVELVINLVKNARMSRILKKNR